MGDGEDLADSAGIFESGVGTSTGDEDEDEGEEDSSMASVKVGESMSRLSKQQVLYTHLPAEDLQR